MSIFSKAKNDRKYQLIADEATRVMREADTTKMVFENNKLKLIEEICKMNVSEEAKVLIGMTLMESKIFMMVTTPDLIKDLIKEKKDD
jgi:hypothetical protein